MHAFLATLVPDSMRGKELGRSMTQSGAYSARGLDEYEKVTVVETYSGSNDTIAVMFKNALAGRLSKSPDKRVGGASRARK